MNPRRITTIVAAGLALATALACGTTPDNGTSTSAGAPAGSGQPAENKPAEVATVPLGQTLNYQRTLFTDKVVATITVANLRVVKSDNQFIKPEKGQFLAADVSIQVTEGKFGLAAGSFKIVAADGTVFDTALPVVKPDLGYSQLAAGQKTSGAITFDAAKGAEKGARIALKDTFADGDAGYWQCP